MSEDMNEHMPLLNESELPWQVEYNECSGETWVSCLEPDGGTIVCEGPQAFPFSIKHWPKRAALIVTAVNERPTLLARVRGLEAFAKWVEENWDNEDINHADFRVEACMRAREVLP